MHIESVSTTQTNSTTTHASIATIASALLAAVLGVALLFAAGFAKTSVLHNTTHDARHSAGFPCH